nr:hypothetical protein [uncultured Treponema sp.]
MQSNEKYKEGQVWSYKTRENESNSKIYIVKIEYNKTIGKIYHIYIDNLNIKNPYQKSKIQNNLSHSPVSEKTLDDSVIKIVTAKYENNINISDGYVAWKEAFDDGKAGVFTIPVNEIIQCIEDVANMEA